MNSALSALEEVRTALRASELQPSNSARRLANGEPRRSVPAAEAEGWPKPEPIQGELPPVEAFSEELLPDCFRALVADVAERMQVPMDYPAVVMVLCLAGAVNRRATIQPTIRFIFKPSSPPPRVANSSTCRRERTSSRAIAASTRYRQSCLTAHRPATSP